MKKRSKKIHFGSWYECERVNNDMAKKICDDSLKRKVTWLKTIFYIAAGYTLNEKGLRKDAGQGWIVLNWIGISSLIIP